MPIDFTAANNANTYASRHADESWMTQISNLLGEREVGTVADIGCGGGIYSRAWRALGADRVIGLDRSGQMVADAQAATADAAITYAEASAETTGLDDDSCDFVFSRAVIHHLDDHPAAFAEAHRILKPGGMVIVQDRTIEDVLQPASPKHIRGWFFELFPRLLEEERRRRPVNVTFLNVLGKAGFANVHNEQCWENRRTYADPQELRDDLMARTGRSILHELSDEELHHLTEAITLATTGMYPLTERDRWTMWTAVKP